MADSIGPLAPRMVKGSAAALVGKLGDFLLSLVFGALLTRVLNPSEVGEYFLVVTTVAASATLARFGMQQATTRLASKALAAGDRSLARTVIVQALGVVFAMSLIAAGVMGLWGFRFAGFAVFGSPAVAALGGFAALWIVAQSLQPVVAGSERAFHHIGRATLDESVLWKGLFVAALATWWLVAGQASLREVVGIGAVTAILAVSLAVLLLARTLPRGRKRGQRATATNLVRVGGAVAIGDVSAFLLGQASVWILGAMAPPSDVALYGLASRLAAVIGFPHLIVVAVVPPIIAKLYERGELDMLELSVRMFSTIAGGAALGLSLVLALAGRQILNALFGPFYGSASAILAVLAVGSAVNVLSGPNGLVLIMTGHERATAAVQAVFAVLMTGVMVLVTPIWGAFGLAVVVSTGLVARNLALLAIVRRLVGVWTFSTPGVLPGLAKSIRSWRASRSSNDGRRVE